MSEYQYYEFQAVDHSLSSADRTALREMSSRADITSTHFTNVYDWGDLKGDPASLMERWFDLHLYLANWGSRRVMMRFPKRLVERHRLDAFLGNVDWIKLWNAGDNLILSVARDEEPEDWEEGTGWLAAIGPLRADVLNGDLRLFYLIWLMAVETGAFRSNVPEPMPGLGPMTEALEAFADFFSIDPDLVAAAAERCADAVVEPPAPVVKSLIEGLSDREKTDLLMRLFAGERHVANELRRLVRETWTAGADAPSATARTVGQLRARAAAIRTAREQAAIQKAAAERKRQEKEAERARRVRLDTIQQRGDSVWQEIEAEIGRRNAAGYDKAVMLLLDLHVLAGEKGTLAAFTPRLQAIHEHHARKQQFMIRLAQSGLTPTSMSHPHRKGMMPNPDESGSS